MRVCVVGGGPAGLGAAYFLKRAGYDEVVVFEKEVDVGGKCHTLKRDGRAYDMGAVEVTVHYDVVHDLIAEFGLDVTLTSVPDGVVLDYVNGGTESLPSLFADVSKVTLALQFAKFFEAQEELADYLDTPGFTNLPESLKGLSFTQWLAKVGAPLLERFFWMPLTCYGYGDLSRIPAVYALKFITVMPFHIHALRHGFGDLLPRHLQVHLPPYVRRLTHGMQDLMEKIAGSLKRPPVTGATIEKVTRSATGVVVDYRVGDDPTVKRERFDRIVLAIPQTLANLSFMDLSDAEKALLKPVSTIHYYTSLTKPKELDYEIFFALNGAGALGPPPAPNVLMFARNWKEAPSAVFYSYSTPDVELPLAGATGSVEALVKQAIAVTGQQPGDETTSVSWQYFPQVPQAELDAGFYDRLDALQGVNGTYYTGGLLNFELVEKAMEYSKTIVERFFPERVGAE